MFAEFFLCSPPTSFHLQRTVGTVQVEPHKERSEMKTILNIYKGDDDKVRLDTEFNPLKVDELMRKAIVSLMMSAEYAQLHQAIYLLRLAENAICVNPETSRRQFSIAARMCKPAFEEAMEQIRNVKMAKSV